MPLLVTCSCGRKLSVRDDLIGRKVKCPSCGGVIQVESGVAEIAPVSAPVKPPPVPRGPALPPPMPQAAATGIDDKGTTAAYWECKRDFSNGLLVVTDDALWFGKLKDKELKRAKKLLDDGESPEEVLDEEAAKTCLEFANIREIKFNKRLAQMMVEYPGAEDTETSTFHFNEHADRDAAFKDIRRRVGSEWQYERRDLNRFQATFAPLLVIAALAGIFAFFVFIAWAFQQPPAEGGGPRVVRTTIWGLIVAYTVGWLGPLWTGIVGGLCIMLTLVWMAFRIITPPIEISLKAPPAEPKEDEDEEEDDRPRKKRRRRREDED
jgi:hypothetical protein